MNDRQLKSLLKVAEFGSFSKAEDELYLSKQALKKQIDSLEDELGFSLIVRTHQGISLTDAGKEFCQSARRLLAEMNATIQHCKGIAFHEETIRIDNPYHPRLMLEKAFDEFSRRFPTVKQHILLQTSDRLVDDILSGRADLAECTYHSKFECPGIACTKLFPTTYKCLLSSNHPLVGEQLIHMDDLVKYPVYMMPHNASLISHLTETFQNLNLNFIARNDLQEIMNICHNKGIFVSKAYYVNYLQPLVSVPLDTDIMPIAAVLHRENPPQVVKEFIKVIKEIYPTAEAL